jgi:hypothetical protein
MNQYVRLALTGHEWQLQCHFLQVVRLQPLLDLAHLRLATLNTKHGRTLGVLLAQPIAQHLHLPQYLPLQ